MRRQEEALQRAVVDLLTLYENRGDLCFAHVPNGGHRTKAEAGIFRALGVKRGVPDILLWTPEGRSFGIELKAGAGQLSDVQVLWHSTLQSLGHRVYVCWSVDEVEAVLRLEGVPPVGKLGAAGKPLDASEALAAVPGRKIDKRAVEPVSGAPGGVR